MSARRAGFTLAEVLAAITLVVILAAVTIPTIMARMSESRADAVATELAGFNTALQEFRKDVGDYPRYLGYLTTMPASNAETYCSTGSPPFGTLVLFLDPQIAAWKGPYTTRTISGDYTLPEGYTVENLLNYAAPLTNIPAYVIIKIDNIPSDVATNLELIIDGPSNGFATGAFTWDGTNGSYRIPVPAC